MDVGSDNKWLIRLKKKKGQVDIVHFLIENITPIKIYVFSKIKPESKTLDSKANLRKYS